MAQHSVIYKTHSASIHRCPNSVPNIMLAGTLSLTVAILSALAAAAPAPAVTDDDILQYALTLEHLEAAFYKEALEKFNDTSFASGGEERALFEQIAGHEATHVTILQSILGDKATKPCTYNFPYNDVQGFKSLAQVLEGVGVSAYLGAAQFLTSKELLTAAGSILTTEARHAAWLATTNARDPWGGPFDTPLAFSQIFSLAAPFITSCPDTNPKLPVKAFPALTLASPDNGNLLPGANVTLTVPQTLSADTNAPLHAAFLTGTSVVFAPYVANQSLTLPPGINSTGTVYVVLTSSNTTATDDTTVAGPAVLLFDAQLPDGVVPGSSTASGNGTGSASGDGDKDGNADSSSRENNALPGSKLTFGSVAVGFVVFLLASLASS